ncbi:MAG: membrane protein insertion efficiency factor YidD [Firmicutes bacterium HGW-Firmicutes-21]|nr:MAG: membrane protein insertion efficiency factor YidD [Firmicutes bacterium HGW-Firmicutes-21]
MKRLFIFPIRLYQKHISPYSSSACRFQPTCSQYAIEAIETRGVIKGLLLAVYRILRCNPFCKGGYDPVPEKSIRKKG